LTKDDLEKLHSKTNKISTEIASLSSRLETKLEHLATREDLTKSISNAMHDHRESCPALNKKSSYPPRNGKSNLYTVLGAAIAALVAVVYLLIELIK